jgi:hypothetical protein
MPLPHPLRSLARTRRFWTDFFWETDSGSNAYPELAGCTIELPLASGYGLSLSLDAGLCYFSLGFFSPETETIEIAWDDQAHWHPHVLRWQELELICRTIALQDAELPHPGLPLLLLHRFVPICEGDDIDLIVPMLESAMQQLAAFSAAEIAAFIERADARDAHFRWRYDGAVRGWCLEQADDEGTARGLYTLRNAQNPDFPFAKWTQMLSAAGGIIASVKGAANKDARAFAETGDLGVVPDIVRSLHAEKRTPVANALGKEPQLHRVCWIVEALLGLDQGAVLKRHVPRTHEPREKYALSLTLPLRDLTRALPAAAGKMITDALDRALGDCNLGGATPLGSTSTQADDGTLVTTKESISIQIHGDLDRGVRLIRDVLWWVGAPASAQLSHHWRNEIPLALTEKPQETREAYLQLGKLRTVHWRVSSDLAGYRLDRVPFPESCRKALRAVLADVGATEPDEEGWFSALLPDGGSLQICLRRLDDDPDLDAATVVLRKLTCEVAQLLYRFMSEGSLLLLPPVIAMKATDAATVTAPWPSVKVVQSALELHDILGRGPYEWWSARLAAK